jgi:hypothetical protein
MSGADVDSRAQEDDVPTLFLAVKSLPRGALVEKQVVLHTGRVLARNEDDEDAGDEPTWTECEPETWGQVIQSPSEEHEQAADCSSSALPGSSITVLCLRLGGADVLDHVRMRLPDDLLCVRVFHVGPWTSECECSSYTILEIHKLMSCRLIHYRRHPW